MPPPGVRHLNETTAVFEAMLQVTVFHEKNSALFG